MIPLSAVPSSRRIDHELTRHEPCAVPPRLSFNRPPHRWLRESLAVMHDEPVPMRGTDRKARAALGDAPRRQAAHLPEPSAPIGERCARVG